LPVIAFLFAFQLSCRHYFYFRRFSLIHYFISCFQIRHCLFSYCASRDAELAIVAAFCRIALPIFAVLNSHLRFLRDIEALLSQADIIIFSIIYRL